MNKDTNITVSDTGLYTALIGLGMPDNLCRETLAMRTWLEKRGINTYKRWSCFLGQLAHESAGFSLTEENLNYRESSLMATWPKRFPNKASCKGFVRNPRKLANKVYGGRMGNDTLGEGYLYRGRGYIQLTGKNNYAKATSVVNLDLINQPELVSNEHGVALRTALWFFTNTKYKGKYILEWCDELSHRCITRAINGGLHGLSERRVLSQYVLSVLMREVGLYMHPVARRGDRGQPIREIQGLLRAAGIKIYKIDGVYGKGTEKAIRDYQLKTGLKVDGVMGGKTYAQLLSGLGFTEGN